jgi:hypothetical protein
MTKSGYNVMIYSFVSVGGAASCLHPGAAGWVGVWGRGCNWVRGKFLQKEPVPCHNPASAILGNCGEASFQEIRTPEVNLKNY